MRARSAPSRRPAATVMAGTSPRRRLRLGAFVRRRSRIVLILVVALAWLAAIRGLLTRTPTDELRFDSSGPYRVERVVDGDTLLLSAGERVRLIGVDTPETKHPHLPPEPLGREASEFTRRFVEGQPVELRFDRERRDQYDRVLAYVWADDLCLNEELILAGYSRAETRFPYSSVMKGRFQRAEQQARQARRGIWADP